MRLVIALALLAAHSAHADEVDYLMLFAAERIPYTATKAHCFAVVIRVETRAGQPPRVLEQTSLSWLPASMKVRGLAWGSEPGRNVPLDETIKYYTLDDHAIYSWGPYRIQPELSETFKARVLHVETDCRYKAASFYSSRGICDCARAIEEMVETRRRFIGVFGYGRPAMGVILQKLEPQIIGPDQTHPWVAALIGVDKHPFVPMQYGDIVTRYDQWRSACFGRISRGLD